MSSALRPGGSTTRWRKLRLLVLQRDRGICWLCGKPGATTVDHKVPRKSGGDDSLGNLAAAHAACNGRKGSRLVAGTNTGQPTTSRLW